MWWGVLGSSSSIAVVIVIAGQFKGQLVPACRTRKR